jgi:hypothetical protein
MTLLTGLMFIGGIKATLYLTNVGLPASGGEVLEYLNPLEDFDDNEKEIQKPIRIYPNPANDKIYIHTTESEFEIEISNTFGQVIISEFNTKIISINQLPAGTYFVQLRSSSYLEKSTLIIY